MRKRLLGLAAVLGLVATIAVVAAGVGAAGTPVAAPTFVDTAQVNGTADFTSESAGTVSPTAKTIPNWGGSFVSGGVTYDYSMVGTDPAEGPATTTVKTVIVPMNFNFASGGALNGSDRVAATVASPVFQDTSYATLKNVYVPGYGPLGDQSGPPVTTQYGNAVQKAMFWATGGADPGYNVLLGQPELLPAQTIDVPKNQGFDLVGSVSHQHFALVSYSWFSAKLKNLLVSMKIPADVTPIFLVDSVFLYIGTTDNCCVLGYHGATSSANGSGKQQINTYIYAAYSGPGIFSSPVISDIHGLSHEVSEWYADPFVNNFVPPWLTPTAPQYGCTAWLETGDPVVGHGWEIPLNGVTYHPEDEAMYSWFARESPSRAFAGRYTFTANPWFTGVSQGC